LKLTTIREENSGYPTSIHSMRRSLLYKHDDDLRQEMFAVQFIEACNRVLCSCGLDLKLLMYKVLSVGERRGFIEWVPGSVPLSEICQPFAGSLLGERTGSITTVQSVDAFSSLAKAGIPKHQSVRKDRSDLLAANPAASGSRNPIQDYFRSVAHDPNAPYMIRKEVMDTYIKSCAGYSVITYLLVSLNHSQCHDELPSRQISSASIIFLRHLMIRFVGSRRSPPGQPFTSPDRLFLSLRLFVHSRQGSKKVSSNENHRRYDSWNGRKRQ
jgi:hypothetical protein